MKSTHLFERKNDAQMVIKTYKRKIGISVTVEWKNRNICDC
jgi:hypothetical protein